MMAGHAEILWRPARSVRTVCLAVLLLATTGGGTARGQITRSAPSPTHFLSLDLYYEGNYEDALDGFESAWRSAIKNGPDSRWIDSICYHTMMGECYFQMGQYAPALKHYNSAMELYVAFSDWMVPVKFDPVLRPAAAGVQRAVPWGQSKRNAQAGHFPEDILIQQGQLNNNEAVVRGGVVRPLMLYPIKPQEIVRCTALAIRRRREVMGPSCQHDALTNEVIARLSRRPVQPNHWSEAWIDVQLGLALAAGGNNAQAKTVLQRGVLAAGQYDHPLTAAALLELGRLALAEGDFNTASQLFDEATYASVTFYDPGILEEAFRYGYLAHVLANRPGLFAPLSAAIDWARVKGLRHLHASLLLVAAENHCSLAQPDAKTATALLDLARGTVARRDMGNGKIGARLNFIRALALYQLGDVTGGNAALALALAFQQNGSHWLFHIALADQLYTSGTFSPRTAMEVFDVVLRDPAAADWMTDPMECLAKLVHPHPLVFEHWFDVALERREHERLLEIADLSRRHRFLTTQPLGGRLVNLRWILEGPAEMLGQQAALQRQDLLGRYTAYANLSQQAGQLRAELDKLPLVTADKDAARGVTVKLEELARTGAMQEVALSSIALRREPAEVVFPPLRSTKTVQQSLAEDQALLAFFSTSRAAYGFLVTKEKYTYWPVAAPAAVQKQLVALLRELGNFEQNKELRLTDLKNQQWKTPARELFDLLTAEAKASLDYEFNELIVVPDGLLWYVPFEALQVGQAEHAGSLISKVRVRYAPTVGLGVGDPRPRPRGGNTAVALGRLFPNDGPEVTLAAFEELALRVPGAVGVDGLLLGPPSAYATMIDRLIVLSDISPAASGPFDWSPLPATRGSQGATLAEWFPLPWGGPDQVLLPGFHTAAENSLKSLPPAGVGNELFLATCGLMSTGTRTVLISRWRPGGQSSFDLIREFAQELPYTSASAAWQRSVFLLHQTPIAADGEPRVKLEINEETPLADHPFFWSGFMLVDSGTKPSGDDELAADKVLNVKH